MSSEAISDAVGRLENLLLERERREDFLLEVIGDLSKDLGAQSRRPSARVGRAEVNRLSTNFTRDGNSDAAQEDEIVEELKIESRKVENMRSSLLGQFNAEKRRHDQTKADQKKEEARNGAKNIQIANLGTKKTVLEKTNSDQEATIQRLERAVNEKDSNISKLETSLHSRADYISSLVRDTAELQASKFNQSVEIGTLQKSVTSKDQEITKAKKDFDTLLTKATEYDPDQQRQVRELKAEIKRIEADRPTLAQTCRWLQIVYDQFTLAKQTLEQQVSAQQEDIELLMPEEETIAHMHDRLRESYGSACLIEWKNQDLEIEVKGLKKMLEKRGGEIEEKREHIKMLFEKLTERSYRVKSGHVLQKGRRMSW